MDFNGFAIGLRIDLTAAGFAEEQAEKEGRVRGGGVSCENGDWFTKRRGQCD